MNEDSHLRIGELSRRAGVSPERLRAWERRYGLLQPIRSPGGLRLYSLEDVERVRLMARHIADGVAAREAAALAARAELGAAPDWGDPAETERPRTALAAFDPPAARAELARAVDSFDEPAAQAVIDQLLSAATIDAVLAEVVVPFLREVGERWQRGQLSVAHEHFASNLLRGRLLGLARGWGAGTGPLALLACPPGERHDLGLIAFGLALRARGWRVALLGGDTPAESIVRATNMVSPALLVVSATAPDLLSPLNEDLARLAAEGRTIALAGAGATEPPPEGVLILSGDPVGEATRVSELATPAR